MKTIKEKEKESGYNAKHPELRDGEIWLTNVQNLGSDDYSRIGWETKRLGNIAYTLDGEVILSSKSSIMRPVFVKLQELIDNKILG